MYLVVNARSRSETACFSINLPPAPPCSAPLQSREQIKPNQTVLTFITNTILTNNLKRTEYHNETVTVICYIKGAQTFGLLDFFVKKLQWLNLQALDRAQTNTTVSTKQIFPAMAPSGGGLGWPWPPQTHSWPPHWPAHQP